MTSQYLLYYSSQKCELSITVYKKLQTIPQLFNLFTKLNVVDRSVIIPKYVHHTPTIIIPAPNNKHNLIEGANVIQWIAQWIQNNPQNQIPVQRPIQGPSGPSAPSAPISNNQRQPPNGYTPPAKPENPFNGFEYDPTYTGITDLDGKELLSNDGTSNFAFLDAGSSYTPAPPMPPSRNGNPPNQSQFPAPMETKDNNKNKDEMTMKLQQFQQQRDMDVPGEIKRDGGVTPPNSRATMFNN